MDANEAYRLDDQVGFILRKVQQRHLAIFSANIPNLTPRQFATLAKLCERGAMSQNELGRQTAMDAATIKGVVDRLRKQGLIISTTNSDDRRRLTVRPSAQGRRLYQKLEAEAHRITAQTLAPLSPGEQRDLLALLQKLT